MKRLYFIAALVVIIALLAALGFWLFWSTPAERASGRFFQQHCALCHGSDGQGGDIGPSLVEEGSRKSHDEIVDVIKNPIGEMPKLFPSTLSDEDVNAIAAYVEDLK